MLSEAACFLHRFGSHVSLTFLPIQPVFLNLLHCCPSKTEGHEPGPSCVARHCPIPPSPWALPGLALTTALCSHQEAHGQVTPLPLPREARGPGLIHGASLAPGVGLHWCFQPGTEGSAAACHSRGRTCPHWAGLYPAGSLLAGP